MSYQNVASHYDIILHEGLFIRLVPSPLFNFKALLKYYTSLGLSKSFNHILWTKPEGISYSPISQFEKFSSHPYHSLLHQTMSLEHRHIIEFAYVPLTAKQSALELFEKSVFEWIEVRKWKKKKIIHFLAYLSREYEMQFFTNNSIKNSKCIRHISRSTPIGNIYVILPLEPDMSWLPLCFPC